MSQPVRGPLDILIDLAHRKCDEAAEMLAAQHAQQRQLEARGAALEQYREDYVGRIEEATRRGVDVAALRNLRQFLARIDQACAQHARDLQASAGRVAAAQCAWQNAQRRLETFSTLERRRGAALSVRAQRAEQRTQDEAAARLHRARTFHHPEDRT